MLGPLFFLLLFDRLLISQSQPVAHCAQPEVPENGHVVFPSTGPLKPGTIITYKCDVGFVHLGPEKRRCESNGLWSNNPPICAVNVGEYKPALERRETGEWGESVGVTDGDLDQCGPARAGGAWSLDLLQPYHVYAVELLLKAPGRSPEAGTAELSIEILLSGAAFSDEASVCYSHRGPLELNKLHTFVCTADVLGRHVTVTITSGQMRLCEVFVLSTAAASPWQCGSLPSMDSWGVEGGSCYHGSREMLPWEGARRKCAQAGASLVGPVDLDLTRYLKGQLSRRASSDAQFYWLGLLGAGDGWRWWNGQGLDGSSDWPASGAPGSLSPGPYAVALSRSQNWQWTAAIQTLWNHFLCRSKPLFCASPGVPAQGGVMLSSQTYGIGTTAFYYCNYGYVLRGIQSRTCNMNGTWSDLPPSCYPVNCGSPSGLRNGDVTLVNGTSAYGGRARHECALGFRLLGQTDRECQADGTWSGAPPLCRLVTCPPPPPFINGTIQIPSNSTGMGAVAQYSCFNSFRLVGSKIRQCNEAGEWTPEPPLCLTEEESASVAVAGPEDPNQWRHQTNLMTGFIVAVVVLLIMIFLILFMLWKKKKLFYDNFSMSTVYATPTVGGSSSDGSSNATKGTPLYAYNNPSLSGSEEVYCAPASLVMPSNSTDPTSFASSEVYYSLAKVTEWKNEEERRQRMEGEGNLTLTQLELPPDLLKVEKLPNGNFHLTLPCIRSDKPARPGLPFPVSEAGSNSTPSQYQTPSPAYAQPRVPPRTRRPRQPITRPKKFHTMVGMVRKKLTETTSAIIEQLGTDSIAVRPQPRRSPLEISGPMSPFRPPPLPTPIYGSDPDLRSRPPASPTPTEILFSFDDADDEDGHPEEPVYDPTPHHDRYLSQQGSGEYQEEDRDNIYEQLPPPPSQPPPHFMGNTYC